MGFFPENNSGQSSLWGFHNPTDNDLKRELKKKKNTGLTNEALELFLIFCGCSDHDIRRIMVMYKEIEIK